MEPNLILSQAARTTAGSLLLAIVFIEYGGLFVLRLVTGRQAATPFQKTFSRAGHAHAGVLVILSLVVQLFADALTLDGPLATVARTGVPLAAILMPAGFFLSAIGRDRTEPNRFILLLHAGAVSLALGVVSLGAGLLGWI